MCGGPKSALRRELPNHVTLLSLTAEQIDCSLQKKKSLGCQQHVHPYSIRKKMKDVEKGFLNKVNLLKRSYFLPIDLLADLFFKVIPTPFLYGEVHKTMNNLRLIRVIST